MSSTTFIVWALLVGASLNQPASGSENVRAGQRIFAERCAVCHSTTSGAGQGPGLGGVVGRKAASTAFGYTQALRESNLTWDRATLDRFLTAPPMVVPGTAMPLAVPVDTERGALIDYLTTLAASGKAPTAAASSKVSSLPGRDFRGDGPGVRHHVVVADLPAPYATPSAQNGPQIARPPTDAHPLVPPGFRVDIFAHDLAGPRLLRVSPSGDLFVAESLAGRIRVLRAADGRREAERNEVFADGLDRPFGIAFYPPGPDPQWVYVAETNAVVRFPYRNGDLTKRGNAEIIVPSLVHSTGGHWTRDVVFSADGSQMFVSVGSSSNVAEGNVDERDRADVLLFDPQGKTREVFASGIRNCVALALHPTAGDLWCATNERDGLGDDLVPDYVTRVQPGGFYGWPWFYLGNHVDPRHAGEHRELASKVRVPDVLLQSHSAPLGLAFYESTAFPAKFHHRAFVALHGSWNRSHRTGPKVVSIALEKGVPTGDYEDFMTGLVVNDESVWARPVGVAVAHDGSLFVSEDANGTIWRVAPTGD